MRRQQNISGNFNIWTTTKYTSRTTEFSEINDPKARHIPRLDVLSAAPNGYLARRIHC
ncbi:hypothetical protein [Actinocorallia longicatena]|uniref:hypothetical protein n=1 Tax=Actinocorallia longicatena TaxID=111803 RepID=UPI0031DA8F9F